MAGEEDIQARAKEFFALWQEQAAMSMRDPHKMGEILKTLLVLQGVCYTPHPDAIQPNSVTNAPEQPHSISPMPDALPVLNLQPAWHAAKQGLLDWSPHLQSKAAQLTEALKAFPSPTLHKALQEEAVAYYKDIAIGLNRYLNTPVPMQRLPTRPIWQEGSSSLLCPTTSNAQHIVLFVPSLINRSYIFDLKPGHSFLEYMGKQEIPAMILDWGEPGETEKGFGVAAYIERLERATTHIHRITGKPVILAGYCMGGVMSLAHCRNNPPHIAGLALFATPWDFHASDATRFAVANDHIESLEAYIATQDILPKETIQMIFYLLYAQHIHKKYQTLSQLDPISDAAQELLPIEYWVNDGIGLSQGVARDCLIEWGYKNVPMKGMWNVNGQIITPESIACPSLVAIAKHDRIASYHAALPLAEKIKGSTLLVADTGHVGMVAGKDAREMLWEKFAAWVKSF